MKIKNICETTTQFWCFCEKLHGFFAFWMLGVMGFGLGCPRDPGCGFLVTTRMTFDPFFRIRESLCLPKPSLFVTCDCNQASWEGGGTTQAMKTTFGVKSCSMHLLGDHMGWPPNPAYTFAKAFGFQPQVDHGCDTNFSRRGGVHLTPTPTQKWTFMES